MKPKEITKTLNEALKSKIAKTPKELVILGIMAGVYIALASQLYLTVIHDASTFMGTGIAKLIGGSVFVMGLILVVMTGSELFTGNNLLILSWLSKKIKFSKLLKNWSIIYIANFIGSILLAALIFYSGVWKTNNELLGIYSLNVAASKLNFSFVEAFIRGILCNFLVCLAIWLALTTKHMAGKISAMFFPIMGFVAMGFEHCVANMYYFTLGKFLSPTLSNITSFTWSEIFTKNLIPVTLGNIIGGALIFGILLYTLHVKKK